MKKNTLLHYLDRFHTLVEEISKLFDHFFHIILVQKVISRNLNLNRLMVKFLIF